MKAESEEYYIHDARLTIHDSRLTIERLPFPAKKRAARAAHQ
jgi:hypothetical protein